MIIETILAILILGTAAAFGAIVGTVNIGSRLDKAKKIIAEERKIAQLLRERLVETRNLANSFQKWGVATTLHCLDEVAAHERTAEWLVESGFIPEEFGGIERKPQIGKYRYHIDGLSTGGTRLIFGPGLSRSDIHNMGNDDQAAEVREMLEKAYDAGYFACRINHKKGIA